MSSDTPLGPDGQKLFALMGKMIKGCLGNVAILQYFQLLKRYEQAECGISDTQPEPDSSADSDELTAFQVRGLRDQIVTYHKQPKESSRILRVLRRLDQKELSDDMLLDTGVQFALHLVLVHPRADVKEAAMNLLDKWELGDGYDPAVCPTRIALKRQLSRLQKTSTGSKTPADILKRDVMNALEQLLFGFDDQYDLKKPGVLPTCSEDHPYTAQGLQTDTAPKFETSSQPQLPAYLQTRPSNKTLTGLMSHYADQAAATGQSVFSLLAPDLDMVLGGTAEAKATDMVAFTPRISRSKRDFVAVAKQELNVDDRTINMISGELERLCDDTLSTRMVLASVFSAKLLMANCSNILQERIRDKSAEIAAVIPNDGDNASPPSVLETLIEEKSKYEKTLSRNEGEVAKGNVWIERVETDILIKSLGPLKALVDALCLPETKNRSVWKHVQESILDSEAVVDLQHQVDLLSTQLNTCQVEQGEDRAALKSVRKQLTVAQSASAKLKKEMDNQISKYYKDVESQVEDRMRQEKANFAARLQDAEAKAQQHDSDAVKIGELQKRLKDALLEKELHLSTKLDLVTKNKELQEEKKAMQQGYEQMRQAKEEAEARAAALGEELRTIQSSIPRQLTHPPTDVFDNTESRIGGTDALGDHCSSTFQFIKPSEQITEADRLDMIALKWRKSVSKAEGEQAKHARALEDIEVQIGIATRKLEKLQSQRKRRTGHIRKRTTGTETSEPVRDSEVSPTTSATPSVNGPVVEASVDQQNPWTTVGRSGSVRNTVQQVKIIRTES